MVGSSAAGCGLFCTHFAASKVDLGRSRDEEKGLEFEFLRGLFGIGWF